MIQKYVDQGSTQTAIAAMFVISSIRTFTWLLPDMMDNYRDKGMKSFNSLMPKQKEGIKYVMKNKEWLYNLVQSYKAGDIYPEELLETLLDKYLQPCNSAPNCTAIPYFSLHI